MLTKTLALLTLGTLPLLTACGGSEPPPPSTPPVEAAKPAAPAGGSGSITGKISFEGQAPAAEMVKVTADPKCVTMHPKGLEKQPIRVKDGGLADVYVYVKGPVAGSYPAPTTPVLLDQNGCNYSPHIVALQVGQPLTIRNSDDTLHNIHPRPKENPEFNVGQPRKGMESTRTFEKPEVMIPVGCDVHPWMRSYISVAANPFFAVTSEDGSFSIKGLPAGDYEVEAVHEKLGSQTGKVSVKDGEAASLDLTFKG
jgi:plastocyanin